MQNLAGEFRKAQKVRACLHQGNELHDANHISNIDLAHFSYKQALSVNI